MAQLLLVVQFSNQKKMKIVDYRFRFSERIEILQNILFFLSDMRINSSPIILIMYVIEFSPKYIFSKLNLAGYHDLVVFDGTA